MFFCFEKLFRQKANNLTLAINWFGWVKVKKLLMSNNIFVLNFNRLTRPWPVLQGWMLSRLIVAWPLHHIRFFKVESFKQPFYTDGSNLEIIDLHFTAYEGQIFLKSNNWFERKFNGFSTHTKSKQVIT